MNCKRTCLVLFTAVAIGLFAHNAARAAKVTVDLGNARRVTLVGAINRWDLDGNSRRPVDPKAKINAPYVDASAAAVGKGKWVFKDLPSGTYDLLIMAEGRVRIEGFQFVPVLEFDPFFPPDAEVDQDAREYVFDHIKKSPHYENKVQPMYLAGDEKTVRVLVMLLRDKATTYTPGAGTIRHEVWQYTWQYGGWKKEKRTRVFDRILMQVSDLRQWTWLWDAKLGGIEVEDSPLTIEYQLPRSSGSKRLKGLYPY